MKTQTDLARFVEGFRDEHRVGRDVLLAMIEAFRARDGARFGELMNRMNIEIGPHMRY